MTRASLQRLNARAQRKLEELYRGTLVIGAHTFTVARGAWRNRPDYDDAKDQQTEVRTCAFRIRKELLTTAGITIAPGVTTGTLDGVAITIGDQSAGSTEDAFRYECQATAPTTAQA